ncbi:unnamed protein product [Tuber melanosporum]|uniref:(Perigord truffle) hypothetical protein n=1 Tax=Tuber melanosporum (strain Mel28) TaxID=656061 RepID=D5GDG4_TUBMM|nr:uncharacterized protein GSTUM_00000999001 [Tuber melanosporum]CAZ82556.1 unnamed protein product [Tuber melanosporum]
MGLEEVCSPSDGSDDLSVPPSPRRSTSSLPDPATAAQPLPAAEKFHPAVYVVVWIILSSAVIIFNKWVLFNKKFLCHSNIPYNMAFGVCNDRYPDPRTDDTPP